MECLVFFHLWWWEGLLGIVVWAGICAFLESSGHLSRPFWLLQSPLKSRCHSSMCVIGPFFLQLSIFFLCYINLVLILLIFVSYVFYSFDFVFFYGVWLFGVLFAFRTLIGSSFLRLGWFTSKVLLKIFSMPLTWISILYLLYRF